MSPVLTHGRAGPPRLWSPVDADDHVVGRVDAPITLVEYGDYECLRCGTAEGILEEVRAQLGGQLRFVFRNFPLPASHPHAQDAAELAEAAAAQGEFWEMHDTLFRSQDALTPEDLVGLALELGLDSQQVVTDLTMHVHADRVRRDVLSGRRSGVRETPTFFVNGVRYEGSWRDPSRFAAALRGG